MWLKEVILFDILRDKGNLCASENDRKREGFDVGKRGQLKGHVFEKTKGYGIPAQETEEQSNNRPSNTNTR